MFNGSSGSGKGCARRRLWRLVTLALALAVIGTGFWLPWWPRVRLGERRIDPRAAIDPNKGYHLVLWDFRQPLAAPGQRYEAAVETMIAAFRQAYPNVEVEIRWLDWLDGPQELEQALGTGKYPDIYGTHRGTAVFDPLLQLPLEAYLAQHERDAFAKAALSGVAAGEHLWAWPRWVEWELWGVNAGRLKKGGVALPVQGRQAAATSGQAPWTYQGWTEALERAAPRDSGAAVLDLTSASTWRGLLLGARPPLALDSAAAGQGRRGPALLRWLGLGGREPGPSFAGDPALWTRDRVEAAAGFVAALRQRGLLGRAQDAAVVQERIDRVASGRSVTAGPVNSRLAAALGLLELPQEEDLEQARQLAETPPDARRRAGSQTPQGSQPQAGPPGAPGSSPAPPLAQTKPVRSTDGLALLPVPQAVPAGWAGSAGAAGPSGASAASAASGAPGAGGPAGIAASAPVVPLQVSSYVVFARPEAGDDHLRAAVELVRFLAGRTAVWLAARTGVAPAQRETLRAWAQGASLPFGMELAVAAALEEGRGTAGLGLWGEEKRFWNQLLAGPIRSFAAGESDAAALVQSAREPAPAAKP